MKIIKFEEIYRDDMIFTVLQAKDALGRKPTINPDLLDIKANYIKPSLKRKGIGSKLLNTAELWMRENGIAVSKVHLGTPKEQWFESYVFYPKHGYIEYEPRYMMKVL